MSNTDRVGRGHPEAEPDPLPPRGPTRPPRTPWRLCCHTPLPGSSCSPSRRPATGDGVALPFSLSGWGLTPWDAVDLRDGQGTCAPRGCILVGAPGKDVAFAPRDRDLQKGTHLTDSENQEETTHPECSAQSHPQGALSRHN